MNEATNIPESSQAALVPPGPPAPVLAPTPLPDSQAGYEIEQIDGKQVGVGTPMSGQVLGSVGLWSVRSCHVPDQNANETLNTLGLPGLDEIRDGAAATRAMGIFSLSSKTKPDWDISADEIKPDDKLVYDFKHVKGGQYIIHRTIYRPGEDGKIQRIPVNLARFQYHPEKFHTKDKQKIIDVATFLTIEHHTPQHPIVSQDSLDKMLALASVKFQFYLHHYTGVDVSEWLRDVLKAAHGAPIKPGVTFFPEEYRTMVGKIQQALREFNKYAIVKSRFGMMLKNYPVFDIEEERAYIASKVEEQVMLDLRNTLDDTVKMLQRVDEDKKIDEPAREKRKLKTQFQQLC